MILKTMIRRVVLICTAFCLIMTGLIFSSYTVKADDEGEQKSDFVNILLVGQDKRSEEEERQRADTMMVVTLDRIGQRVCITSFMRDLYVEIPGYGGDRMNAAYQYGGFKLLDQTLEDNFGVHIDGNVVIDFQGFTDLVDSLGGIDLVLTQDEADYIAGRKTDVILPQHLREDWDYLTEGLNTLNGEQALIHVRNRWIGQSDYERTRRQRDVLMALFDKVKGRGLGVMGLIVDLLSYVDTDVPMAAVTVYSLEGLAFGANGIDSYRIPVDGSYTSTVVRGMDVLVPDLEQNRAYLQENIGFTQTPAAE